MERRHVNNVERDLLMIEFGKISLMKILFVCWGNVGRSQMAAAIYNNMTKTHDADSAGTEVDVPGESLLMRAGRTDGIYIINAMDSVGIDVRRSKRTQLEQSMLNKYDYVISMADKKHSPSWLRSNSNYIYWHITDPGGKDYQTTLQVMQTIKRKVEKLISTGIQIGR